MAKKLIVSWYFLCSTSDKTELGNSGVHQWCWKFQFECNKLSSFPIMAYNGYVLAKCIQSKVHSFCLSSIPARRRKVLRSFTFFPVDLIKMWVAKYLTMRRNFIHGCSFFIDLTELELFLLASSSVPFSSIFMEMELVPFQTQKHCYRFWNLELIFSLHNTAGMIA